MIAQKLYILIVVMALQVIIPVHGMEKRKHRSNSLIEVVPVIEKLFDEGILERFYFHNKLVVINNLCATLKSKEGIFDDKGTLKSCLPKPELIALIMQTPGYFSIKNNIEKIYKADSDSGQKQFVVGRSSPIIIRKSKLHCSSKSSCKEGGSIRSSLVEARVGISRSSDAILCKKLPESDDEEAPKDDIFFEMEEF